MTLRRSSGSQENPWARRSLTCRMPSTRSRSPSAAGKRVRWLLRIWSWMTCGGSSRSIQSMSGRGVINAPTRCPPSRKYALHHLLFGFLEHAGLRALLDQHFYLVFP